MVIACGPKRAPVRTCPQAEDGSSRASTCPPTFTQNPPQLWERVGGGTSHWVGSAAGPVGGTPPAGGDTHTLSRALPCRAQAPPSPGSKA